VILQVEGKNWIVKTKLKYLVFNVLSVAMKCYFKITSLQKVLYCGSI